MAINRTFTAFFSSLVYSMLPYFDLAVEFGHQNLSGQSGRRSFILVKISSAVIKTMTKGNLGKKWLI